MRRATIKRCSWVSVEDPLMLQYHDREWGVPVHKGPDAAVAGFGRITGKPDVIPGEKFALPVTWVRGIKLRLFAFSSVAASHDSFATGLRSGRPIFVLPLLREYKTPGCPIQRVLENDFDVFTGTARDFIRLRTVELHWKDKEKT